MPQLIMLVLDDPDLTEEVLEAWMETGITGATILHSTGLAHHLKRHEIRDDLPLIPSLESLMRPREEPHRTLITVVDDDFDVQLLADATAKITGDLQNHNTGILFTVAVGRVWGLQLRQK